MASVICICEKLLALARNRFPDHEPACSSIDCDSIAESVLVQVMYMVNGENTNDIQVITSLEYDFDGEIDTYSETFDDAVDNSDMVYNQDSVDQNSESLSQQSSQEWEHETIGSKTFTFQEMKNITEFYDKAKSSKLKQTKIRYSKVTDYKMIQRFKEYLNKNGKNADKFKQVEEYIINRFNSARSSLIHISDSDIKRWGVIKAKKLGLKFQASSGWVHLFKLKNRIVSRKITKYLTTKEYESLSTVSIDAYKFVEDVVTKIVEIEPDNIFNFDQSGFTYEYTPKRSLSHKGEKDTLGLVVSHNANTHSYTIMPLLSMSGKFVGKLLICLQETGGQLGPRVQQTLEVPKNIFLVATKSGKLDKPTMKRWIEECVRPISFDKQIVLIYDSWTGQTDDSLYQSLGENCIRFQIPAKATSLIQPLDKYIFRQYKIFRHKIFERIVLDGYDMDLHKRQNVIKMHSLIYNQLQSDLFRPMFQYSWYACKFSNNRIKFRNVCEILFKLDFDKCECECESESFIECAICNLHLCFGHFFIQTHFHSTEGEDMDMETN